MSEEFGNDFITLLDDDGNEVEFEHIDTLELNGETYVALVPVLTQEGALEADGELFILKVVFDDESGEEILSTIEDDEEYDRVADIFVDRLEDMFEIEH